MALLCAGLLLAPACAKEGGKIVVFDNGEVRVVLAEPVVDQSGLKTVTTGIWVDPLSYKHFDYYDAAFIGTITNLREVEIAFTASSGDELTSHATLYDFELSEVLFAKNGCAVEDTVVVYNAFTSAHYPVDFPILKEGESYLLFLQSSAINPNEYMQIEKYADYYIMGMEFILPCTDAFDASVAVAILSAEINASAADALHGIKAASDADGLHVMSAAATYPDIQKIGKSRTHFESYIKDKAADALAGES